MTLDFNDNQINQIVNALAQRPYAEVYELMNHIQRQVVSAQQSGLQVVQPPSPTQQELVGT